MGGDPSAAGYVKPKAGEVWDFMRRVSAWIDNPLRKGIPD
jgi:hypothetical protein